MIHDWGEVVTKVTVGEPAVGSPPYQRRETASAHTDWLIVVDK